LRTTCLANGSLLVSLDEPAHPLPAIISHHTASIQTSAQSLTERQTTAIELVRRQLAAAPEPSSSTRRLTYLQGIAKSGETAPSKDGGDRSRRGWDTDAVEDMWNAVLTFVRDMGGLLNDLAGLKDLVDRSVDKAAVLPPSRLFVTDNPS
jgi:hypothetical protein